jgi:hypothetical protein
MLRTDCFREAALHFKEHEVYTKAPEGSRTYVNFWKQETDRCLNGFHAGHDFISGYNYFYLNYSPIYLVNPLPDEKGNIIVNEDGTVRGERIQDFARFWDGDQKYFYYIDEAENARKHGVVLKARGKGFSFKGGSKLNRNFFLIPGSKSFALASSKEYLLKDGLLTKAWEMMDFINEHTAWRKRRQVKDTDLHKRASYKATVNGKPVEKGYKSEIIGVTLMNNPNRARGKRGKLLLFEEFGSFIGGLQAWQVARPSVEQGGTVFGLMVGYGTGGEEGSAFEGMQEIFENPKGYNVLAVNNEWDEGMDHKQCGFFVPDYMNKEGFMTSDGYSMIPEAKKACERERIIVSENTKDRHALKRYIAEHCNTPREAMMKLSGNIFPSQDLLGVLSRLELDKKYEDSFYKGRMIINENGEIDFQEDKKLKIITQFPCRESNPDAPCIMYEAPVKNSDDTIPFGIYIAGIDPYDFDTSSSGSLGSMFIINKLTNRLVFEYTARPETAKTFYEQCRRALMYYNARALYENEKKGIFDYFESQASLYLLCDEPTLIADILKKPGSSRKLGLKMPEQIKRYGEGLIYQWLIRDYDAEKNIKNYHKIRSMGLLKELTMYSDDTNCDRVMALMCIMYQLEEDRRLIPNTDDRPKYIPTSKKDFFNRPLFKRNYINNLSKS